MTRELFVSSTPHETKVGMVEDDLLAEIYLERENEYTLAGSIYKGRVTRVLPGMQSAFVDIGLERDAFLYVSDFMELSEDDEVEEIPTARAVQSLPQPAAEEIAEVEEPHVQEAAPAESQRERSGNNNTEDQQRGGRNWRDRRRRRGRRGGPEERAPRPASEPSHAERDFGPPPGYQPIVLPGESISKYRGRTQGAAASAGASGTEPPPPASAFPEDEPLFAEHDLESSPKDEQRGPALRAQAASVGSREAVARSREEDSPWDPEQQRLHQMNVSAVFGNRATEQEQETELEQEEVHEEPAAHVAAEDATHPVAAASPAGTVEEEEIEDEELGHEDLATFVAELEEDAVYDDLEEETREAADYHPVEMRPSKVSTPSEPDAEPSIPFSAEPVSAGVTEVVEAEGEEEDEAEEEAELEEAQAEAEALVEAEARGDAPGEARVEVRGPSGTAGYTQRAQRPAFDRRPGPRGRRGGRRFRRQEPQNVPQITELLKEGQEILVQIAKEPIAKKGARITSHIALPGRFLVYMPTVHHTGVSRKISSEEERQRLKRIILSERENGHGGFIVRTAAQGASEEDLRADIRFLKGLWAEIKTRAEMSKAPALIYHDLNVVERVLRDQVTSDFAAVWVDNEQEYERILRFANASSRRW